MINNYLCDLFSRHFSFLPTSQQQNAIQNLCEFLLSNDANSAFIMKGYAGTGKTSVVSAMVKAMTELNMKTVLLAPTGRAAKILSIYTGQKAYTIHKKIYRQKAFSNEPIGFNPADNLHKDTLFIIDEASMISNNSGNSTIFGTGHLLDDLIEYIYSGEGCRILLIGDTAQLPPVMQQESPALNRSIIESYNLHVSELELTQVVRQNLSSGILFNATRIREALASGEVDDYPKLKLKDFEDIKNISGEDLIDTISSLYGKDGMEETMVICRSNKRATIYNNGIRNRILYREEEISSGDLLMVAKNNYFWSNECKEMEFIANGEIMQVIRVKRVYDEYGFRFADISARFDAYDVELDVKILLNTLQSESPALSKEDNDKLFYSVLEEYEDISTKSGKIKKMKVDPHYNVLQVKFAYAVTCHKAQGGQWKNIFLDIGYITEEMLGEDFYRWFYTALTRATDRLFLVNLPHDFEE